MNVSKEQLLPQQPLQHHNQDQLLLHQHHQQQQVQLPPTTPLNTDALKRSSSWSCFVSRTVDSQDQHDLLSGSAKRMVIHSVPPRPVSKTLGRPRRRTSPEDHATLEKEYLKDPKPNKATRAEIVQKVSMNDREVQIWFQNRRQNDRRKAKDCLSRSKISDLSKRPLAPRPGEVDSPAELLASGSDATVNESQISSSPSLQGSIAGLATPDQFFEKNETSAAIPSATSIGDKRGISQPETNFIQRSGTPISTTTAPATATEQMTPINNLNLNQLQRKQLGRNQPTDKLSIARPHSIAFPLSPALRISFSPDGEAMIRGPNEPSPVASPVNPKGAVRISMSADGKACVREESEDSPAKPIRRRRSFSNAASAGATNGNYGGNAIHAGTAPKGNIAARSFLRRSASAFALNSQKDNSKEKEYGETFTTPSLSFGRSRDSKLWEMYCDHDTRSTISKASTAQRVNISNPSHHQHTQSQPAAPPTPTPAATSRAAKPRGAAGGGRKKLQRASTISTASPLKRRALAPRNGNNNPDSSAMASHVEGPLKKRSKLSRASSSLARLENINGNSVLSNANRTAMNSLKPSRRGGDFTIHSGGDSDKENWEPGFRIGSSYHAARGESRGAAYDRFPHIARREGEGDDEEDVEGDDARRHVSQSSRTSEPADLDCIQGLLSLSQGAWR